MYIPVSFNILIPQNIEPGINILLQYQFMNRGSIYRCEILSPLMKYWTPGSIYYGSGILTSPLWFPFVIEPLPISNSTWRGVSKYYGRDLFSISGFRISHDLLNPGQFFAVSIENTIWHLGLQYYANTEMQKTILLMKYFKSNFYKFIMFSFSAASDSLL